jgi:hypothetical protein
MPPSPPGALDDDTARTLRAAAEALVGEAGRDERYAAPFRWRAAHLPGYLELYRRFSRFVDTGGSRFVSLSAAERRRRLGRRFPGGRLRHLLTGWAAPERMRMRRNVIEEILAVYAATDAWSDLGYQTWPGAVRGLEAYREPPPGARTAR